MRVLYSLLLIVLVAPLARAQVTAASCSEADINTAWASVTNATHTFTIPSCSGSPGSFTSQLTLTVPTGSTNLTIQGSTTISGDCYTAACTATDNTILVDNCGSCGSGILIFNVVSTCNPFRVTGLTIKGGSGGPEFTGVFGISGHCENVRFDHNHIDTAVYSPVNNSAAMGISGWIYGVADHNKLFLSAAPPSNGQNNGFNVTNAETYNSDSLGVGDQSWADDDHFGSNKFFFIENNTIQNGGAANDCGGGGRVVMRYNYIDSVMTQEHPTHPDSNRVRGCRAAEIYNNNMIGPANCVANGDCIQAVFRANNGTNLVWGNQATAGYQTVEFMLNYRHTGTGGIVATPNGYGPCGTDFNGTGSNWDQNTSAATGHRCLDNIGTGKGDLLIGGFTADGSGSNNVENQATGCFSNQSCGWPRQALVPVYAWLNNWARTTVGNVDMDKSGDANSFTVNSDFYPYCSASNPAYFLCTSAFDGTQGTGSGTLAGRPATCTVRVGYWATDTNTLYTCDTTDTWTTYYTPYAYPHPLTGSLPLLAITPGGGTNFVLWGAYVGILISLWMGVPPKVKVSLAKAISEKVYIRRG